MKLPVRSVAWVAAWALPLLLTGCVFHRTHQAQNQPVAPPLTEEHSQIKTTPVDLPPSANTIPSVPTEIAKAPTEAARKAPARRRRLANKNTQEAVNVPLPVPGATPAISAIGQLSSGDPADVRQQTEESIASLERGLNGINRSLSTPEQKTADQIREFLKQAQAALTSGDVDGAHTLAAKAKVLLAELTE